MKKSIIFGLIFSALFALKSNACDVCGCSAGGNLMGILPQFHNHFIGLRYSQRSFKTIHPPLFSYATQMETSVETFQTMELFGRYYPNPKLQIFGFVPMNSYTRQSNNQTLTANGLGDVQLLANYVVINNADSLEAPWKNTLLLGGGIKLPTGKVDMEKEGVMLPQIIQLGTGSWDWIANAVYTLRYKKLGMNLDASVKLNTENKFGYKFGNRLSGSARLFYWARYKRFTFLPQVGAFFDAGKADVLSGLNQIETGGKLVLATAGMDMYYKNYMLGFSIQPAVYQHLGLDYSTARNRVNLTAIVLF